MNLTFEQIIYAQVIEEAEKTKAILDKYGRMVAEFVKLRLWFDYHTTDGGFCSNNAKEV